MRIVKNLFLVSFVAYSSMFAVDLEAETKSYKKSDKKFYKLHKNHGLETEAKNDKKLYDFTKNSALEGINLEKSPTLKSYKKNDKKLYDFTKNSALEGINLEKSPTLKSYKKSDKKFYKQLAKNNIAEGVSMPVVNFNKALSFGPYFERTKSKKTQYMDGGLMMHIRF
ncbi:hypothetical protein AC786_01935 [Helicobacter pylori]|uniref:hypothetical protein n=1 Tax=Helicobacter pylori TaxID=210 RepID=UPI0006817E2A|nr:hypothetical protein [Helicobacter pylori]KMZ51398.1 hypothetical protein AC786_01935 [Helicobacter pylori]